MAETEIIVPWPATLNDYYRAMVATKDGRIIYTKYGKPVCTNILTKKARDYRTSIKATIWDKIGKLNDPIYYEATGIALYMFPPDKRRRDIDNYFKGLFDGFTKCSFWADDNIVKSVHVDWCETVTPKKYPKFNMKGLVVVRVWSIPHYEPLTLDSVLNFQTQSQLF